MPARNRKRDPLSAASMRKAQETLPSARSGAAYQARAATGLSQSLFSKRFGIAIGTLRDWEQGRKRPDGPARALLRVIEANPDMVQRALEPAGSPLEIPALQSERIPLDHHLAQWRPERPEEDLADFQFRAIVTVIARCIEGEFRLLCRERGITDGEMRILLTLRRNRRALRQAALRDGLLLTSGAITKQVQRLERRKLIYRMKTSEGLCIQLTNPGHEMVSEILSRLHVGFYSSSAAFRQLPASERLSGLKFLRRVLAGISENRLQSAGKSS